MYEENIRKKPKKDNKKSKTPFISEEELDKKKMNNQFKKNKQYSTEDEEDWKHWDEYYNH